MLINSSKYLLNLNKNSIILPYIVGQKISIYNGKNFIDLKITDKMVGFKLGNFVFTRKVGKIHNLSKKKGSKGFSKKKI